MVVATASLELGIDIGHVDLVCHLGAPRALATLLQRVGRSGHGVGGVPKGILFPMTRDELVQCAAAVWAVRRGALDRVLLPMAPLDILAQQIVATAASAEITEDSIMGPGARGLSLSPRSVARTSRRSWKSWPRALARGGGVAPR